ncbi:GDP-mannose 4,6-dehydratase [Calidifontibacter indicus]|uniref:GDP-mannose 4,6-dehydratase n=1 Tax=Calidifontibacter indicus TaxID=419650 RepID=UPI003D716AEF
MTSLVTGAAGFVGSTLVARLLADGHTVRALDSFTDYYDPSIKRANFARATAGHEVELVEDSLISADYDRLLDGVDRIYHLAGQPGVRKSWGRSFAPYVENNVSATQVLLEKTLELRPQARLVYASSSSVYGESSSYPCVETQTPRPRSPYGVTKLAAEHLCSLYAENFGLSTVALRFFTVYGPGQRPDMAFQRFCLAAHGGTPITIYGDGEQIRDFTFVGDIVEGLRLAGASDSVAAGEVLNLSGGSSVSVNQVLDTLRELADRELQVDYVEAVPGDVTRTGGSADRAYEVLDWTAKTSLRDGLAQQLRSVSG